MLLRSIWFLSFFVVTTPMWHAFEKSLMEKINHTACEIYHHDAFDTSWYSNMKLWPGLHHNFPQKHQHTTDRGIHGWRWAVNEIYKKQHPPPEQDCKQQKFMIGSEFWFGFGAEFHVWGAALAGSLSMDRIFIQSPDAKDKFQISNDFCKESPSPENLECYYEPWSSCVLEDALGGKEGIELYRAMRDQRMHQQKVPEEVLKNYKGPLLSEYVISDDLQQRLNTDSERESALNDIKKDLEPFQTVIIWNQASLQKVIPTLVLPFVDNCLPMQKQYQYYWWRAGRVG